MAARKTRVDDSIDVSLAERVSVMESNQESTARILERVENRLETVARDGSLREERVLQKLEDIQSIRRSQITPILSGVAIIVAITGGILGWFVNELAYDIRTTVNELRAVERIAHDNQSDLDWIRRIVEPQVHRRTLPQTPPSGLAQRP